MLIYKCKTHQIETESSVCPVCLSEKKPVIACRSELESSDLYWCETCQIPLYEKTCSCGGKTKRITSDMRPVFPEERLLVELILGKPFCYAKDSVWNCAGNSYVVNGKRIKFSVSRLKELDAEQIRTQYNELKEKNTYAYFDRYIERWVKENQKRLDFIEKEAMDYIRKAATGYSAKDMFVSFSGGKDSTVTSDLVFRALSDPAILHIFGDTTLEFPETYDYVEQFKAEHRKTPVLSSRNKEKNFEELCMQVGPPSRVMRWCCTIFKTGAINRKISVLFKNKKKIVTFYGIQRSESASRNNYERETEGSKINKQITISPIIDWMDYDVWLYLLGNHVTFNAAYRLGYARVGCWCCPNNSGWSEFLSKVHMHEKYEKWHTLLVDFAKQIGKPDAEKYIADGKWKARQGGNGVEYAKKSNISFAPCALEENAFNYELQRPITEELYQLFLPFGMIDQTLGNQRLHEVYIVDAHKNPRIKLQGKINDTKLKITIFDVKLDSAATIEAAEEKIKCQLTKYQMCMGCKACAAICKHNAITIFDDKEGITRYQIDSDKCVRCCECVNHFVAGCYMRKVVAIKRK